MAKNPVAIILKFYLVVFIIGLMLQGCSPTSALIPSPTANSSTALESDIFQTIIPTGTVPPVSTPIIKPEIIDINNANRMQLINHTTIEGELLVPSIVDNMVVFYQGNRIFSKILPDFKDGFSFESTVDLTYHNLDGSASPDGQILAWYHYDKYRHGSGKMEVWRINQKTGTFIGKVLDYDGTYQSTSIDTFNFGFMDDNKSLVVLQQEDFRQHFTIHDTSNLNNLPRVIKLPDPYWYVVASPHFRYAASFLPEGHADTIKIIDLITDSSTCWGSQDHEGLITVEFSPKEDFLVVYDSSESPSIKLKQLPECSQFQKFDWDYGDISKFYISPDQSLMGIVANGNHFYMWDLFKNQVIYEIPDVAPFFGIFSSAGDLFAFCDNEYQRLNLIDAADGSLLFSHDTNCHGIEFSDDGSYLYTGILGGDINVFTVR